jgi:hypothetical protein
MQSLYLLAAVAQLAHHLVEAATEIADLVFPVSKRDGGFQVAVTYTGNRLVALLC